MRDLDELEKLAEAATPGGWHVTTCMDYWVQAGDEGVAHCGDIHWPDYEAKQPQWEANAAFIAAARSAVPALIARVRELEGALAGLIKAGEQAVFMTQAHSLDFSKATRLARAARAALSRRELYTCLTQPDD